MKLSFESRNGELPHGKPKVLMIYDREDFKTWVPHTKKLLLEAMNCSVWYDEENYDRVDIEDLKSAAGGMSLLVFLVTKSFLENEGGLVRSLLGLRMPILPIVYETGLDQDFMQVFGNIHYFAPFLDDGTTIPFKEKVEKLLKELLIEEKELPLIQKCFRAKLFMSYRKKDRKEVRELIRLLHEKDEDLDFAIWYDELLHPGEDFNENIDAAMKGSELFCLSVTPSLLEKNNYVANVEYKRAKDLEKTGDMEIIPVEMLATDRQKYADMYKESPEIIPKEYVESVLVYLRKKYPGMNNQDLSEADKWYYLGIAYLHGISVEKDTDRGKILLTKAAQMRQLEAMKKLATVYREGIGGIPDFGRYMYWSEESIKGLEEKYARNPQEESYVELFECIFLYAQTCHKDGRMDHAVKYYKKMEELSKSAPYRKQNATRTMVLSVLGDLACEQKDYQTARDYYYESLKLRLQLVEEEMTEENMPIYRRHLGLGYLKLGDAERKLGCLPDAREMYTQCLLIRQAAYEQLSGTSEMEGEAARDYAVILARMGELYEQELTNGCAIGQEIFEKVQTAFQFYFRSEEIREKIYKASGKSASLRDLNMIYMRIAVLSMRIDNLEQAEFYFQKGVAGSREKYERDHELQDMRDVARALILYSNMLKFPLNIMNLQDAIEYMGQAAEKSGRYQDGAEEVSIIEKIAQIYADMEQKIVAMRWYAKAEEKYRELAGRFADESDLLKKQCYSDIARINFLLAILDQHSGAGLIFLQKAYKLYLDLARIFPEEQSFKQMIKQCEGLMK